ATAALVVAQTAALVVAALLLARALGRLVEGSAAWSEVSGEALGVLVALAVRAALTTATEWRAHRGATRVVAEMRDATLRHVARLGPRCFDAPRAAVPTSVTSVLDAFPPYLVGYLPQPMQTALLAPAILVFIATQVLLSAATLAITLPLLPVFMWLIGLATERTTRRRL